MSTGFPKDSPVTPEVLLTIAGFDPSSGAGITADLQVFAGHQFFGISAITALTVQSTQGVRTIEPVSRRHLRQTLDWLVADIPPVGIKIGMLADKETAEEVASFLAEFSAVHPETCIVYDPVLGSSSGTSFLNKEGISAVQDSLLHQISWLTPNWQELAAITGLPVEDFEQAESAMLALSLRYPGLHLVVTGGDCDVPTDLLRTATGATHRLAGTRIATTSTHGTGCAFSSALLCALIRENEPLSAVIEAKNYVEGALRHAPGIGHGKGPMGLLWTLNESD